jgi:hypothetical protein
MFIRAATISQFKKDSVRRIYLALDVFTNFENNSSSWYGVVDQSTGDKAENPVFFLPRDLLGYARTARQGGRVGARATLHG